MAGSAVWNFILVGVGFWLGTNIDAIDGWITPVVIVTCAAIAICYLWRVITWKPREQR